MNIPRRLGLLALPMLAVALWWLLPGNERPVPDEPTIPPSGEVAATGAPANTAAQRPPSPPVTLAEAAPPGNPASTAALRLRTERETASLRERHRPHFENLGVSPDTVFAPRIPPAKEPLVTPPGLLHAISVKFIDDHLARAGTGGSLIISSHAPDPALLEVIRKHGLRFAREQTASDERLALLEARAAARTGTRAADLTGILSAIPADRGVAAVRAAAEDLLALEGVEFVTLSSLDVLPPPPVLADIAPPSELLTSFQTYRGNSGILMDWAWSNHQIKGSGVRVTDCEYAYNANHEDLSTLVTPQPNVNSYYTGFGDDHGTAVLGVLTAGENEYGMTGMVPEASVWFYPESSTVNGQSQNRLAAVTAAIADSDPGDVVLLEMQTGGAQGDYGPAEYNLSVWNAVKTGTDAGVLVVAAAGNGSEDLDAPEYLTYRNRGDSGSIIVGAGSSARAKLSFSTYGSRVNVQGWGQSVATLGYGGLRAYGGDVNQEYTSTFNGTSSASPIVTSAVVALQDFAKNRLGRPLAPLEMRDLLVTTGKPQTGTLSTPIGPLPDMQAAVTELLARFDHPDLTDLQLSGVTLVPGFDPETTSYSADAGLSTSSVSVMPTTLAPGATIEVRINGGGFQQVASGGSSPSLSLVPGVNTIDVRVTAPVSAVQKTYTVSVTRSSNPAMGSPTSSNLTTTSAVLGGHVLDDGGLTITGRGVVYTLASNPGEPSLGGPGTTDAPVSGTTGVFSTSVGGLTPGTGYRFRAYATNASGTSYSSGTTFTTISTEARLQSISLSGGVLSPGFSPGVLAYTSRVSSSAGTFTARGVTSHAGALLRMRINAGVYRTVASGSNSPDFALNVGTNTLELEVTAEDGATILRYLVDIIRPEPPSISSPVIGGLSTQGAVLGAEVVSDGGNPIIERGILLAPTLVNSSPLPGGASVQKFPTSGTTGPFTLPVTGLTEGVRYSFRGFCRTEAESAYTEILTFVTSTSLTLAPGVPRILTGRYVAPAETVGFQIEVDSRMQATFSADGSTGLSAVLRDANGEIVSTSSGTGSLLFDETLEQGSYSLEIHNGGFWGQAFSFSANPLPSRPDLTLGPSPSLLIGDEVYDPDPGQTASLVSRRLKPVRGYFAIGNRSGTPAALRLRGSRGTSLFDARYTDASGNQTAGITSGLYTTRVLSRDDSNVPLTATFTPSKKKLSKTRGKKSVILRKTARFTIGATAVPSPDPTDSVEFQVKTQ